MFDFAEGLAGLPAATEADAKARFEEFAEKWGKPYPAIKALWGPDSAHRSAEESDL